MSALTYNDLRWAYWASRDAARADERTLGTLGDKCTPDHSAWLQSQIAQHRERAQRFQVAASELYIREHVHA